MSPRGKKRAAMLKRLSRTCDVRRIMRDCDFSPRELADAALGVEATLLDAFGGPARFTGNNHTFANGALAYEVLCKKCQRPFWVTTAPYALCPDCDPICCFR